MPLVIDETGVQVQTLDEIIAEWDADLRDPAAYGPDFVLDEAEIIPQMRAICAEREARVQQAVASLAQALKPGEARGVWVDNHLDLFDLSRLEATHSTVQVELTGPSAGTIPGGRVYRHVPSQTLWDQPGDVTTSGSPATAETLLVAQDEGPIDITAGTEWEIVVGDSNVSAVESIAQSSPGRFAEDDEEAEERRRATIATQGGSTEGAIKDDVLEYLQDAGYDVDDVVVNVNNTDAEDADGQQAHSVHVIVDDNGLIPNDVVAQAVWLAVGAGPAIVGGLTGTATDASGRARTVAFSRPGQVEVHLQVIVDTDGAEVPIGDTVTLGEAITAAVVAFGAAGHPSGRDVIPFRFVPTVFGLVPEGSVISVFVTASLDGSTFSLQPISIDPIDQAVFAADRVEVVFS